ncbi:MAG: thioesterase [Thiohalocapsa sp. PB-PSB1]|jgi:medium-chain acyl-[acyl-carrier-protein] hydrolase|nr:MAG: hypothetical protein N838_03740 [Thiohalocapsa sp. PB-PSB1]QQO54891.1 MAG: thioesterase [Thiohalocapsa sp. PB-PSB1]HCS89194.1 thioesterase [Chromatiaceae bacterium]
MRSASTPWLTLFGNTLEAPYRIFAFPYTGAGPVAFSSWARGFIQHSVDLIGIHYPGRGARYKEPPISDMDTLISAMVPALLPYFDRPFRFFGHSMGALIAFETARALRAAGAPAPDSLFVSAFRAPHMPNLRAPLHQEPEDRLYQGLTRYGGTPAEILGSTELRNFFAPLIRADLRLHERYVYRPEPPLDVPIIALSGAHDEMVPPWLVNGWLHHSSDSFQSHVYDGGHFFINDHRDALIDLLCADIG